MLDSKIEHINDLVVSATNYQRLYKRQKDKIVNFMVRECEYIDWLVYSKKWILEDEYCHDLAEFVEEIIDNAYHYDCSDGIEEMLLERLEKLLKEADKLKKEEEKAENLISYDGLKTQPVILFQPHKIKPFVNSISGMKRILNDYEENREKFLKTMTSDEIEYLKNLRSVTEINGCPGFEDCLFNLKNYVEDRENENE